MATEASNFTIPIVFHIVGTTPTSITDAQMYALLDTLNKDFGGNNADSTKILPGFRPNSGHGNIRFCLAQRTPGGILTNGIVRYTSYTISSGSGSTADPIKSTASGDANAWDPTPLPQCLDRDLPHIGFAGLRIVSHYLAGKPGRALEPAGLGDRKKHRTGRHLG